MKDFRILQHAALEAYYKKVMENNRIGEPTEVFPLVVVEHIYNGIEESVEELEESFKVLSEKDIGKTLMADLIPKKLVHLFKRTIHAKHYKVALKLARDIMKDKTRDVSPQQALVIAAQIVDINPKELMKVLDKRTRYK